jgi:mRNA-degrading endonuclease RelE of RelBE toxin-antitoxin system
MLFIETSLFTKKLPEYLSDVEYGELQDFLIKNPDAGDVMQGTCGLRKLRWGIGNRGKRGGLRIIYYWQVADEKIYFVTLYAKNEVSALSEKEKKDLCKMLR